MAAPAPRPEKRNAGSGVYAERSRNTASYASVRLHYYILRKIGTGSHSATCLEFKFFSLLIEY